MPDEVLDVPTRPTTETLDPSLRALWEQDDGSGGYLFCAACSEVLGRSSAATEINGAHEHFCTNPHGYEFHVRCYSQALGCAISGAPHRGGHMVSGVSLALRELRQLQQPRRLAVCEAGQRVFRPDRRPYRHRRLNDQARH